MVFFFYMYDFDLAVISLQGCIEVLHHKLKFIRLLGEFGGFRQV